MVEEKSKIIITVVVTIVFIAILACLMFIDIPILGTSSIKTIISQHKNIEVEEAELLTKQKEYQTLTSTLNTSKENFESEKAKYEAISDDTISIIKETNTEENYSLEYMWIKLGNYATKNNLVLVMVEPGNTNGTSSSDTTTDSSTDESVVEDTTKETSTSTDTSGVLQIQVTGSYIDLSDFVFEVENDSELNFKLDNILMEYVSGTTVKTTFDVKNVIINK